MRFKIDGKKEPICILPLVAVQSMLGAGPMYIGHKVKNGKEYYAGLVLVPLVIAFFIASIADSCYRGCSLNVGVFSNSYCASCPGLMFQWLYIFLYAVSWLYIIGRLFYLYSRKEAEIRLI
jgi:hypothetical protein